VKSKKPPRLLVVEDEDHLAMGLKLNFSLEGFAVDVAQTAREAGQLLVRPHAYALIVLDVMLPDLDGFELCEQLRNAGNFTPVIMLTARATPEDRVRGLEAGADDYLIKPFDLSELLARVRSLLRRQSWECAESFEPSSSTTRLEFGQARVDFRTHQVEVNGEPVKLTRLELDLLRYFADHAGRVLDREELLEKVWQLRDYPQTRTVDNYVLRLRKHFEPDPSHPIHFLSVRGSGYRFCPIPESA
jgi:two-component system OmpR family response regulator